MDKNKTIIRSTTVVCVRDNESVVIASDGQVTLGTSVIKSNANKIRTFHNDQIIVGFAGSTADALTLFDRLEKKCEEFSYNLKRAGAEERACARARVHTEFSKFRNGSDIQIKGPAQKHKDGQKWPQNGPQELRIEPRGSGRLKTWFADGPGARRGRQRPVPAETDHPSRGTLPQDLDSQ